MNKLRVGEHGVRVSGNDLERLHAVFVFLTTERGTGKQHRAERFKAAVVRGVEIHQYLGAREHGQVVVPETLLLSLRNYLERAARWKDADLRAERALQIGDGLSVVRQMLNSHTVKRQRDFERVGVL